MKINMEPGLTFDDVLLDPGYSGFLRPDINVSTQLSRHIALDLPLVSAPMDTVTEEKLAIALARLGGLGVIHRNLTIAEQAKQVSRVKAAGCQVGAAVGSRPGYEERVKRLVESGVDVIVVDSAHGYAKPVIDALQYIKKHYDVDVIAGNIATGEGAQALIDAGADGLRVGMGPGAICTTRIVSGMGVPQLTAIMETAKIAKKYGVPVIADGGINYSGDIAKALAAGASTVMMGRLFAATRESPGEIVKLPKAKVPGRFQSIINGKQTYEFKRYRGMGSIGAMKKGNEVSSEEEYHGKDFKEGTVLHPEGVEGLVPCSGDLRAAVEEMIEGLKSGMYYTGNDTLEKLRENATFHLITMSSLTESHPHDIYVETTASSYSV